MRRMTYIEKGKAPAKVQEIFSRMESGFGFVPNMMKILAHRPEILERVVDLYGALTGPGSTVDPKLKELVAVYTSQLNRCDYCVPHHRAKAEKLGVKKEQLAALAEWRTSPHFSEAEKLALDLTEMVVRKPDQITEEFLGRVKKQFSEPQLVELNVTIGLLSLFNRFNDTFKTELEPQIASQVSRT